MTQCVTLKIIGGDILMSREYLSIKDICNELNIGKTIAYQLIKENKIKSCRIGKKRAVWR